MAVWHSHLNPDTIPDLSDIGVAAAEDGDDYVLNGLEQFTGIGPKPDLLWALVKLRDAPGQERPNSDLTFSCLVPANREGISYAESRRLSSGGPRSVVFDQVRVPRYYLLGLPGEGALLMQTAAAGATENPAPHGADPETDVLQQRLLDLATQSVNDPDRREVLLQLVMDSYIDRRVSRLSGCVMPTCSKTKRYHLPTSPGQNVGPARRKAPSEAAGQVLGPFSLLDREDPRAPAHGWFEGQQRKAWPETAPMMIG